MGGFEKAHWTWQQVEVIGALLTNTTQLEKWCEKIKVVFGSKCPRTVKRLWQLKLRFQQRCKHIKLNICVCGNSLTTYYIHVAMRTIVDACHCVIVKCRQGLTNLPYDIKCRGICMLYNKITHNPYF